MVEEVLISQATQNNWQRLGVNAQDQQNRLSKRANKRFSKKTFVPVEYLYDPKNKQFLDVVLAYCEDIERVIYSLALNLLLQNGLVEFKKGEILSSNPHILEVFEQFGNYSPVEELLKIDLPSNECDFLGVVYQSMLLEGDKNKKGSYYTPKEVVNKISQYLRADMKFLDPCCGTGSFLLTAAEKIEDPENICGFDLDKTACFISRVNLILKYKDKIFFPRVFNCDFLLKDSGERFDLIATNPPWGAVTSSLYAKKFKRITSGESFSYFICHCENKIAPDGVMFFVLPESILNVKAHCDIRDFILNKFKINMIELLGRIFSGVLSNVIAIHLDKNSAETDLLIVEKERKYIVDQKFYELNFNKNFSVLDNKDVQILDKIYSNSYQTLKNSLWGLGIVTGNNSKFISGDSGSGEKIYSGKNIVQGEILDSNKYINYQRESFQQVAPDKIYRTKEKLVYKFISKKLVFAYDDQQRLFLNSANILIPRLKGYSVKQVMACLNSKLFQYIYQKRFNELKVLKGNLSKLPFPCISSENLEITDDFLYKTFDLSACEISYIEQEIL